MRSHSAQQKSMFSMTITVVRERANNDFSLARLKKSDEFIEALKYPRYSLEQYIAILFVLVCSCL